ncbi:tricarballylate utilization 4Fe-4S protein TcuB [Alterinioella nitratireducens]|uniref:tricarballylate utilization 4Fe-4S protein TcuB n=1 Tax=Alterinioella nitratireducens TaxID=2735915 RepID=UPI001557E555|nr:tricarballylate utilization 4Fe-4S protein TcuB [Alterinioella nitratireducens]NPD21228.1 tricarballylate utilization 4Fe-4S protein TcuB [Alterinioella nitratireducens]
MHATDALTEADRQITICNACRYCEGLCAVFPALEMNRHFADGDLNYLANLCHNCGACYHDCQFSPPHEFALNIPKILAEVRKDSYGQYAWPRALAPVFARNGLLIACLLALSVALFLIGMISLGDPGALWTAHTAPEGFYALMPHTAMVWIFGSVFLFAMLALAMGVRHFWRDTNAVNVVDADAPSVWQALKDAGSLRYLDGGGVGCFNEDDEPDDNRRLWHHLTFYGFLLCFAATSMGTVYHYAFGWPAPYAWWDLPPLLGIAGGLMLTAGTWGLLKAKRQRLSALRDERMTGMDVAFILMLLLTAVTGLLLRFLGETPLMGLLLAVHLGVVLALFLSMPYGKFVHGIYRTAALCRYAMARRHGLRKASKAEPKATDAAAARG